MAKNEKQGMTVKNELRDIFDPEKLKQTSFKMLDSKSIIVEFE
jgi:hypothetical protein